MSINSSYRDQWQHYFDIRGCMHYIKEATLTAQIQQHLTRAIVEKMSKTGIIYWDNNFVVILSDYDFFLFRY